MSNYKVGDNVRVLDTSRIELGEEIVQIGGVAEVVSVNPYGNPRLKCRTGSPLVISKKELQFIEMVSKSQRLSEHDKAIASLEKEVTSLKAEIEALKQSQKVPVTAIMDAVKCYNDKSPNQKRAEIIEKAKGFVDEITNDLKKYEGNRNYKYGFIEGKCKNRLIDLEFIVNEDKRTIVVLAKGLNSGKIFSKGIAKCNPEDVFNKWIGMAIALGRALGIDVSGFENAIQPSEVAIGQIIEVVVTDGVSSGRFHEVDSIKVGAYGNGDKKYSQFNRGWCSKFLIRDDTNAQYEISSTK